MVKEKTKFGFWTNNQDLDKLLFRGNLGDLIDYQHPHGGQKYLLLIIDLEKNLENITSKIIDFYQKCRENKEKLTVVLINSLKNGTNDSKFYLDLLSDLSQGDPIHRLLVVPHLFVSPLGDYQTPLTEFLQNSINHLKIEITKKGNNKIYPIDFLGLENAILKSTFLSGTAGKNFVIGGEPLTDLALAYLLKKKLKQYHDADLEIEAKLDSLNQPILESQILETQAYLNWKPSDNIEEKIAELVSQSFNKELIVENSDSLPKNRSRLSKIIKKIRSHKEKIYEINPRSLLRKTLIKALELTAAIYLLMSGVFMYSIYLSLKTTEQSLFYLRKGDIQKTTQNITKIKNYLQIIDFNSQFIFPVLNYLSPQQNKKNQNLVSLIAYTTRSIESLTQTYKLAEKLYLSIGVSADMLDYNEVTLALKSNLQLGYENLSQIEIILNKGDLPSVVEKEILKSVEYIEIKKVRDQLTDLVKIVDIIPSSLVGDVAKNIVVVFQNTSEQRGTGGTIDYVYHLSLENGKKVAEKIYTGQSIDLLEPNDVVPPPLVKQLTGTENWKIRDLSYNPDFPQTASNLYWILEKKLNFKPDTIIFANEKIFKNFGFDPNTTDFKYLDAITQIANKFLNHQINFYEIGEIISSAIGESNLLFWTTDSVLEQSMLSQNYSGSVRSRECHPGVQSARECISQTSHLSISNFSAISLSGKLRQSILHKITLEPEKVAHKYEISYEYIKNVELQNRDLTEIYQVYLPQGSTLKSVSVDGTPLGLFELFAQSEVGLDRYQFPVSTTFNSKHQIVIEFDYFPQEKVKLPIAYSFTEIRQPGSNSEGVTLEINHPPSIKAQAITDEIKSENGKIIYQFPKKTSTFGVHFVPNQI